MMSPLQSSLSLALRPRSAACHNSRGPQSLFSVCVEPTGPVQRGSSAGCWFCLHASFWPCTAFSIASLCPDCTWTSGTEASYKVVFGTCFPGCAWCHGCPEPEVSLRPGFLSLQLPSSKLLIFCFLWILPCCFVSGFTHWGELLFVE